jgi:hypothetical protein
MGLHFDKGFNWKRGKHERPCPDRAECAKALQLYLDGEVTDEELKAKLTQKLTECSDCVDSFSLQKSIREAIRTKLECKGCPQELAAEIRTKINQDA